MAQTATRRRRAAHHEEEHENEERWLVSFADMMTLLFCLFMVLFAISSVNTSKFESLQRSLQEAFSGAVLDGGRRVMETGSSEQGKQGPAASAPLARAPVTVLPAAHNAGDAAAEQQQLEALKRRVDDAARRAGVQDNIATTVADRGLVVRLRTDGVFFASGSADLQAGSAPVLRSIAQLVAGEDRHPIVVEGYTDSMPVSGRYPSNWELSAARASSVLRALLGGGVPADRDATVRGFAERHPIESNSTDAGRAANRRVEIVLTRLYRRSP
jgi:chemotaxis protein MotB